MIIRVINDGNEVFCGTLSQFLADNDHDEWLTEECKALEETGIVELNEMHSGHWVISVLDNVMGVNEAAELWSIRPGTVKNLCAAGKVHARKIDNRWIIDKNQPNPSKLGGK